MDTSITQSIGGGAIFLVEGGGCSSGETKIAEGIRDAKNRRFVLYIAFAGKSGGRLPSKVVCFEHKIIWFSCLTDLTNLEALVYNLPERDNCVIKTSARICNYSS